MSITIHHVETCILEVSLIFRTCVKHIFIFASLFESSSDSVSQTRVSGALERAVAPFSDMNKVIRILKWHRRHLDQDCPRLSEHGFLLFRLVLAEHDNTVIPECFACEGQTCSQPSVHRTHTAAALVLIRLVLHCYHCSCSAAALTPIHGVIR